MTHGKGLMFIKIDDAYNSLDWVGYVTDRKCTSGYCTFVWGNLVTCRSKKQRVVAKGSIEVEYQIESDGNGSSLQLYEKLSFSYPSLLQPLIHERDTYLAWSLKRSKVVKSKRVVGVIGRGHMNGVIYAITSDQGNLRFRDLAGKKAGEGRETPIKTLPEFQ
ncbi:traB domain-containing protein isoform X2 [Cucumis melo var. makuwa]|uniref:TraB domain-containing protein isoform X2 n=1 Tax=Cucumis melo var. makuwa TaxID=1194695 RepID=A0A5A7U8T0_CUCMM|nr:traB domain-containing protein isoform X2 [Cucumis melo var. makuwa]